MTACWLVKRQVVVANSRLQHILRQRYDLKQPHRLNRKETFASRPTRSGRRATMTDHAEGRGANKTLYGIEFRKRQGASCWDGVLPLEEHVKQDVGIEQYPERLFPL